MDVKDPDVIYNEWIGRFVKPTIEFHGKDVMSAEEFKKEFKSITDDEDKFKEIVEKIYSMGLLFGDPFSFIVGYVMRAVMEDECEECKGRRAKIVTDTMIPTEDTIRLYQAHRLKKTGNSMIEFSERLMRKELDTEDIHDEVEDEEEDD